MLFDWRAVLVGDGKDCVLRLGLGVYINSLLPSRSIYPLVTRDTALAIGYFGEAHVFTRGGAWAR